MSEKAQEANLEGTSEQNFINYYGLKVNPLALEEPFYFFTTHLKKSLKLFNYLTSFSHKIIISTASKGAGKTTFLEQFEAKQSSEKIVCNIKALKFDTPSQLLHELAEKLELNVRDDIGQEKLSAAIQEYAVELADEERTIIVIIEEAHVLNEAVLETIYLLTQSETGAPGPIKLIFSAENEHDGQSFVETIKRISISEKARRELFFHSLPPFSLEDCKQYLQACFDRQGDLDKIPFNEVDYLRVHQISQGLPGKINIEAKQIMEEGVDRLIGQKNEGGSRWVLASAVAFCLVAGVMIAAYLWDSQPVYEVAKVRPVTQATESNNVLRTIERQPVIRDEAPENKSESMELEPVSQEINRDMGESESVSGEAADEVVAADFTEEVSSENTIMEKAITSAVVSPNATILPEEMASKPIEEEIVEIAAVHEEIVAPKIVVAAQEPELKQEKPAQNDNDSPVYSAHEQAIMAFKASDYTMQMLGSRSQRRILKFLTTLPESEELRYFESVNKGEPWFVLIFGRYQTRAQALAALESLPADLKNQKPWIRRISGVQGAIKARFN